MLDQNPIQCLIDEEDKTENEKLKVERYIKRDGMKYLEVDQKFREENYNQLLQES